MRTYETDGYQISVQKWIAFIYTNNQSIQTTSQKTSWICKFKKKQKKKKKRHEHQNCNSQKGNYLKLNWNTGPNKDDIEISNSSRENLYERITFLPMYVWKCFYFARTWRREPGSAEYSRERKKFSLRNTEDIVLFSVLPSIATEKSRNNLILFHL